MLICWGCSMESKLSEGSGKAFVTYQYKYGPKLFDWEK